MDTDTISGSPGCGGRSIKSTRPPPTSALFPFLLLVVTWICRFRLTPAMSQLGVGLQVNESRTGPLPHTRTITYPSSFLLSLQESSLYLIVLLCWLLICSSIQCYLFIAELPNARCVSCVGPKSGGRANLANAIDFLKQTCHNFVTGMVITHSQVLYPVSPHYFQCSCGQNLLSSSRVRNGRRCACCLSHAEHPL